MADYKEGITIYYGHQLSIKPLAFGKGCRGGQEEGAFANLDCSLDAITFHNQLGEHMAIVAAREWRCLFSKGCNSGNCSWCHGARAPRPASITSAARAANLLVLVEF